MITLHHGDCLEIMRGMEPDSVDAIIADPPYSSGTRRESAKGVRKSMTRGTADEEWFTSDCLTTNGFVWLMRQCAREWKRILVPGGHLLVFIDWRMMPNLAGAIESADLRHLGMLVWDKTYFGMGSYFRNQHELILHFSKGRTRPPARRDMGNVLRYKPIRNGIHPTEKPVPLLSDLVTTVTPAGGVVFDPFAGSGSTGEAAYEEGRDFIGIELDPEYFEVMRKRMEEVQTRPRTAPMELA